jgi:cobalamin-dependent methionine synthase I
VPIGTIVDAAKEHDATAIGLSALLVSTSKQMPACVAELHEQGLSYPLLVGGAAINRNFGRRILYPGGQESEDIYEPGVFYCRDAFEGLAVMDQLVDGTAHEALVNKIREEASRRSCRQTTTPFARPRAPTTRCPSRRSGASARSRSTWTRSSPTSTFMCCSSCTGAGAV